uniref:E3 ubiquitin-protein ligase n=1 Tax=Anopheles farauti TaxID=69004 RepID=A0A182PZV4_9DIPT
MENLQCRRCGNYPKGEVLQCTANEAHLCCASCKNKNEPELCTCGAKLGDERLPNPIEKLLSETMRPCRYAPNGCTWQFVPSEMEAHLAECRFRPYRCVTDTLNVLKCDWHGLQHEIENHLSSAHDQLGPVFRFRETTSLVFKQQVSLGGLKLVDAFSKRFLFHFFSDVAHRRISFMMIYFGRREEAKQYCFELEIRAQPFPAPDAAKDAPDAPVAIGLGRGVKFVERCYSDSEDLVELMEQERCISLSHRQVRNYLHGDKIHLAYKVRKVDGREKKLSVGPREDPPVANAVCPKVKPRPPPFVFAKKGTTVPANTKRTDSSSSVSSGTSTKSSGTSSSSSGSDKGSTVPSRSPSSASTLTARSDRGSQAPGDSVRDLLPLNSLSSINRVTVPQTPIEKPDQCPLMTPSINKYDVPPSWSVSQTSTSSYAYHHGHIEYNRNDSYRLSTGHYPPAECTTTASVCQKYTQPYKVKDDRPYLMKYPKHCLSKPQPKWTPGTAGTGSNGGWSA